VSHVEALYGGGCNRAKTGRVLIHTKGTSATRLGALQGFAGPGGPAALVGEDSKLTLANPILHRRRADSSHLRTCELT